MNIGDIITQVVRMKGLMPEVNRTTVAIRFRDMITASMKSMFGDDDERTVQWIENDNVKFLEACQLQSPRAPIESDVAAPSSILAQFINKWESVDTWRMDENDEWKPMSQETLNVKATMLRDLREVVKHAPTNTTPGEEPSVQQG